MIEAGLCQRVRALNRFVADVYAERRIVEEGVMPGRVIDTAEYHEPAMRRTCGPCRDVWSASPASTSYAMPTGASRCWRTTSRPRYSYAAAARRALAAQLDIAPAQAPRPLEAVRAAGPRTRGRRARRWAHPRRGAERRQARRRLLRHEWAATALGIPLVEPEEFARRDDIDIVYRRTNADRLDTSVGRQYD